MKQWIATAPSGEKFLFTVFTDDEGEPSSIEVAPRTDPGRWGAPFPVIEVTEGEP